MIRLFQHYKGDLYVVIDGTVNDSTNATFDNLHSRDFVYYQSIKTGTTHVREDVEFHGTTEDGQRRFRSITDPGDIKQ